MRYVLPMLSGVLMCAAGAHAQDPAPFSLAQIPESVYAPPTPLREGEGVNQGGVHVDLVVNYLTDYIYRGIDRSEVGGTEDSPNLQVDARLSFDLGKLPHPFVGVFVNTYDADPVSRFQEIRPYFGFELDLRPLLIEAGHLAYIYPERDDLTSGEVYVKITLDDAYVLGNEDPILSPYFMGAYDYDLNNAWYFEVGVSHEFAIPDTGITLELIGDVGYNRGLRQQFVFMTDEEEGFTHFDVGVIGSYSLNTLFNISQRHGEWTLKGYLFYTDKLDSDMATTTQMWGGVGLGFHY
jgi:hypothetical protein